MIENTSNKSKGCFGWLSGIGGAIVGLLTAGASCAAILQYMNSTTPAQPAPASAAQVVVITSEPVSNQVQTDVQTSVSAEEWQAVQDFLSGAVAAEVAAYQYGDPSYATMFSGDALQALQGKILDLNSRGLVMDPHFDYTNSYVDDIRIVQNYIEVDSCEYWSSDYYDRLTGEFVGSDPLALLAQTIKIEYLNDNFYITGVSFHSGQSFCQ